MFSVVMLLVICECGVRLLMILVSIRLSMFRWMKMYSE